MPLCIRTRLSVIRGDLIKLFCIITVEEQPLDPGTSLHPFPSSYEAFLSVTYIIPTVLQM